MSSEQRVPVSERGLKMRRWLKQLVQGQRPPSTHGRLLLEPLEQRQLLAGDVDLFAVPSAIDMPEGEAAEVAQGMVAEGEAEPDLVAFAKQLDDAGVRFFGAAWCPACTQQKQLFEDGADFLPFIEVTNPDRTLNSVGQAEGITKFPTWEFPDGSRAEEVLSLETLSQRSGVAIPTSESPSFAAVGNRTVAIGSPLHIPIDAYDPNGQPLTVTVSSSNPALLQASVLQGNRSLRMSVQGWGDMVFELFEQRAERPTQRIIELTQSGFYDATASSEIIFHRIIDNFVLQAGDPTGTGGGGSTLGDFDDQFHLDLQHNRSGVLSYAKSADDTNDSQFFITEGAQRHLDFNHSIFGQLVEGEKVREAISETETGSSDRPTTDVVIDSFEVFNDSENAIVMLKPTGSGTGTANVTITVTDPDGNTATEIISVQVVSDTVNTPPFLDDIAEPVVTREGTPVEIQLTSQDVEGDPVTYVARKVGNVAYTTSVDNATGKVTVSPPADFVGSFDVTLEAIETSSVTQSNPPKDVQTVTVNVVPGAPTSVDLLAGSDTGTSDSDNITSATPLSFLVSGVSSGSNVRILAGSTVVGEQVASGSTVTITTNNIAALGNGTFQITADQITSGVNGGASSPLSVVFDTAAPAAIAAPVVAQALTGNLYRSDLSHPEEGQGLKYTLQSAPSGMTINTESGLVSWTPTDSQTGTQNFTVRLTDPAGNSRDQSFAVEVGEDAIVRFRVEAVDASGNVVTNLATGEQFQLRIFTEDDRGVQSQGVFAAYLDVLFDPRLASVRGTDPVELSSEYDNAPSGLTTTAGLIDELGGTSGDLSPVGGGEFLVATVDMVALRPGTLVVASDAADDSGHDVLVYGNDSEIPATEVEFGSVSLSIAAAFTATNDIANLDEDSSQFPVSVLANDQAQAGSTLEIVEVSATSAGATVTISTDGTKVLYTPPANFNGSDQFTYTAEDQNGARQTATVTLQVAPVNDAPTANNDTFDVATGSQNNLLDVLGNDLDDPDANETLRVSSVGTSSKGGTLQIGSSGSHILYTPAAGFQGTDTFTYVVRDRTTGGLTDTATVTVTVAPTNPPPIAGNDSFTVTEDSATAAFNVIGNDSTDDPEETITVSAVAAGNKGGTASVSSDGTSINYRPEADFFGTETVIYTLRDSGGAESKGTVTFTVTGVNDPPAADADEFRVHQQATAELLDVLANDDGGVDGDETLTITAVGTTSAGGTATISNGKIAYTPPSATFEGTDTFTYTVTDPGGATDTATVTVNVVEFTPRTFSAQINMDTTSGSGLKLSVPVTLSGTDEFGNPVSVTVQPDATGKVEFPNQAPGNYTLSIGPIPFLTGGSQQQISIQSGMDDGDDTDNEFNVGTLHARYISIADFVSYTPRSSVLVALSPGNGGVFTLQPSNLGGVANPSFALSQDGKKVTVQATRNGAQVSGDLSLTSGQSVQVRGQEGDFLLLRVATGTDNVTYSAVGSTSASGIVGSSSAAASAAGMAAEGEGALPAADSLSLFSTSLAGGLVGEGEKAEVSGGSALALPLPGTGELFTTDRPATIRPDEPLQVLGGDGADAMLIDTAFAEFDAAADAPSIALDDLPESADSSDSSAEATDQLLGGLSNPLG